jgi:RecA-family ATPase
MNASTNRYQSKPLNPSLSKALERPKATVDKPIKKAITLSDKVPDDGQEPPLPLSSSPPQEKTAPLYLIPKKLGCTLEDIKVLNKDFEFIGGLFAKGMLSLLMGGSGIGKSSIAQGAMQSLTDGRKFLNTDNYTPIDTGTVVVIDTEGRIEIFKQRVQSLGATLSKFIIPGDEPTKLFSFQSREDLKLIEECIKEYRPEALIIDSFALFSTVDENTSAVLPCLKWMKDMALKYNLAAITTQLVNKSEIKGGRLTKDSVRGFSGLNQVPELIYAIDNHPNNSNFMRLYQVKNTIAQKDDNDYFFCIEDSGVVFVDEVPTTGNLKTSNRQQIINEHKDKSNPEIADILLKAEPDLSRDTALRAVQRFKKDNERQRQGEAQD